MAEDVTTISDVFFNGLTLGSENVGRTLWCSSMNAHHIFHPNLFSVGANELTISTSEKVNGTLFVRRVYVDGVRQPRNAFGPGTDWIDPASTGSLANGSGLLLMMR